MLAQGFPIEGVFGEIELLRITEVFVTLLEGKKSFNLQIAQLEIMTYPMYRRPPDKIYLGFWFQDWPHEKSSLGSTLFITFG